jgi:hypothetical protein
MAQRSIEILIGRLITDDAFRAAFRSDAITTPPAVWDCVAEHLDPRLQKASRTGASHGGEA